MVTPTISFRNFPIQQKISFGILLTCAIALAVAAAAIFVAQLTTFRRSFTRDLEAIGDMLVHNTTAAIKFEDSKGAEDLLGAISAKPYILRAVLELPDKSEFANYHSAQLNGLPVLPRDDGIHSTGGYLVLNRPVILAGERIATLRLLCDYRTESHRSLRLYLIILALALLVAILLALALSSRLERLIAGPILNLAGTAQAVTLKKDYSLRSPKISQDEVGQLTEAFNEMLAKIEQDDRALREVNQSLAHEIEERKRREEEIERLHKDLLLASRQAGMAEVATAVLHNVGNVLNSVNVSANLIRETLNQSASSNLVKLASLLEAHRANLSEFLTSDPKGRRVPDFISALAASTEDERQRVNAELGGLLANIDHIKEIVATQQNYARVAGITEDLPAAELLDAAVRMNSAALQRHGVIIQRRFQEVPPVRVDKHKVLQILINLLGNARHAMDEAGMENKLLILGIIQDQGAVKISISDNGVGIAAENLTRIFRHGFTTKPDGHGFGLHSGALAAKEMGGALRAYSDGPGKGATFILQLPLAGSNSEHHE